jgi:hypothetical protein
MADYRSSRKLWLAALILIWAVMVTAWYFVVHKPFSPEQMIALLSVLLDLLAASALVCLAGGFGRYLLRRLPGLNALEQASVQFAFGLGVLSLVWLAAGLAGFFKPYLAWSAVLISLVLCRRFVQGWLSDLRDGCLASVPVMTFDKLAFSFVGFIALVNLSLALAPPMRWDSLVYHLEIPRRYAAIGGIAFLPDNLYAGFPGLSAMWFTLAILLKAPVTAAVFGWAVGLIAILALVGFASGRQIFRYRWLAPAILLSGSSVSQALHWAYVDWWVILFGTVVWILLADYLDQPARAKLFLIGVLIGFTIGVKYTAGIVLILTGLVLLATRRGLAERLCAAKHGERPDFRFHCLHLRENWRLVVSECLVLAVFALLSVSPWLAKNWLFSGHPLYPMAIAGRPADPWRQSFSQDPLPARSWQEDVLLPFDATIFGVESAQVVGKPEYSANIGPLYLSLIPALWLGWKEKNRSQKRVLGFLLILAGGNWFLWAVLAHFALELLWPRHDFAVFRVYALLAVAGYQAYSDLRIGKVRLQRLIGSLVLMALAFSAFTEWQTWVKRNPLLVLMGLETQEAYLTRELGNHYLAMQAVQALPKEARILSLWEPRVFYCQADCLTDATLDNWKYLRQAAPSIPEMSSQLCQQNLTHVLFYDTGVEWMKKHDSVYTDADWLVLDQFLSAQEVVATIGADYTLYQLTACNTSDGAKP